MSENLELKSISEILEKDFYIPSYQRGYRWDTRQVEDLLEDILEFSQSKNNGFYCLQPLVIKYDKEKKYYRVIDGQQRLTSILIILNHFNDIEFKRPKPVYKIKYETRSNEDMLNKNSNEDNIDAYYIKKALETIENWFDQKLKNDSDFIQRFYPVLLSDIQFIWYKIKDENEIDVFTRLNIGKIPLTNAELIKALLLLDKTKTKTNEKIILATQWDDIEYKLQNNTFFAFINGKAHEYKKATRIEFIFDLIASNIKLDIDNLKDSDAQYSYYIFDRLLNNIENFQNEFGIEKATYDKRVEFLWDKVKTYFRIFEELYIDNVYYHLVGYLVNNGKNIDHIINRFENDEKDKFLKYLKKEISNVIKIKTDKELFDQKYGKSSAEEIIKNVLFLFNVISTMNGGYSKYPFESHKKQNWSLEHIHAQNSDDINSDDDRKTLLEDQKKYITDDQLKKNIVELISHKKIEEDDFNKIQEKIFKLYSDDINIHTIDNMALLAKDDNSALNSSIFPSKRDKIKKLDAKGSFIPIGTKNVFLKYYSDNVKEAITWNNKDRKKYYVALKETLKDYIKEVEND